MANPPPPRRVVVDDLDSLVNFEGAGWFSVNDAKNDLGNFGPTYLSTLHGTNTSTQLSFTFDGSTVQLLGTNNPRSEVDPDWDCLVDGVNIGRAKHSGAIENNWILCEWKDGSPEQHTLTVKARSQGRTFWVDRFEYTPSPKATVPSGSMIHVPILDNAIKLGDGWRPLGGTANVTAAQGASAEVEFVGTRLSWWGFIPPQFPRAPTTASYSIDGGPATSFALKGLTEDQVTTYNQKFFETPLLKPGPHRVLVVHGGNGQTTPLTLTNVLIEGGNFTSPLPGDPSIFSSAFNSSTKPSNGGSKAPLGAIIGGVVGGLVIIAATAMAIFIILRRRKSKRRSNTYVVPFDTAFDGPPVRDQNGGSTNSSAHVGLIYHAAYQAVPGHEEALGQGLVGAPNGGRKGMPSVNAMGPAGSHGHGPLYFHKRDPSSNNTHTSPPLSTNTSSTGANVPHAPDTAATAVGQPSRRGDVAVLEASRGASSANDSSVVMHEDSGVRMDAQGNVMEVPPMYTAQ